MCRPSLPDARQPQDVVALHGELEDHARQSPPRTDLGSRHHMPLAVRPTLAPLTPSQAGTKIAPTPTDLADTWLLQS